MHSLKNASFRFTVSYFCKKNAYILQEQEISVFDLPDTSFFLRYVTVAATFVEKLWHVSCLYK